MQRALEIFEYDLSQNGENQRQALSELDGLLDEITAHLNELGGNQLIISNLVLNIRINPDFERACSSIQALFGLMEIGKNPASDTLAGRLLSILNAAYQKRHNNLNKQVSKKVKTNNSSSKEDTRKGLEKYLSSVAGGAPEAGITYLNSIGGGGSKDTYLIKLEGSGHLPDELVVRVDRPTGVGAGVSVVEEYRLIELLYKNGLAVPQPFFMESDTSFIGQPFIIVSKVEGENIGDWIEVFEPSRSFAKDLAECLARLHNIPLVDELSTVPGYHLTAKELINTELLRVHKSWQESQQVSPGLAAAFSWLRNHVDLAEGRRTIVHCDVACHNLLAKGNRLTGLLDWETTIIGNPAQDLAYVKPIAEQMVNWDEFLAYYQDAGGILPASEEMAFYELWRCVWQMYFLQLARSLVEAGISDAFIHLYGSQVLYEQINSDLHAALSRVI